MVRVNRFFRNDAIWSRWTSARREEPWRVAVGAVVPLKKPRSKPALMLAPCVVPSSEKLSRLAVIAHR
jgi:hypothetical protein